MSLYVNSFFKIFCGILNLAPQFPYMKFPGEVRE
jgi:hypothetical protein